MSKRGTNAKGKIYTFFAKVQKVDSEAIPTTSRAHEVELNNAVFDSPNAQVVEPPPQTQPQLQPQPQRQVQLQHIDAATPFERDPGLRSEIWEYPKEQRDEVRRAYLKMGPYHWSLKPKDYPLSKYKSDKQNRRFNPTWYESFPWLEYSPSQDRAYCLPCFLFEKNPPKSETYTKEGFKDWKIISKSKDCSYLQHLGGPYSPHRISVSSCEVLMKPSQQVDNVMRRRSQEEVVKNRLCVETTIRRVQWLALQGCALRGHNESPSSENRGNFLELLKFVGELNDNIAAVILGNAPRNANYTAPIIQKQALHLLADKVRKKICEEVGDAKFCILVDEAQDSSTHEQMAIILRFVNNDGFVRERFFAIVGVEDTNASTFKKEIFDALANCELHAYNLRGQGYDGASNMRGSWNGLQALVSKECPQAYYVHCFAHRLQLALVGASNDEPDVWLFFSKLSSIFNFVNASPKRKSEVEAIHKLEIEKMVAIGELDTKKWANQMTTLQKGGETRWSSHFASVRSLIEMFGAVCIFLQDISKKGSTNVIRAEAKGDYIHMRSFEFVLILHLMHKTMGITNLLCKGLQEKSQNILNAMNLVSSTKKLLQEMREEGWESFIEDVNSFCTKHNIVVPDLDKPYTVGSGRSCSQKDCSTLEQHYRCQIFIQVIEYQVLELKNRFNDEAIELLTLSSALDPHGGFKSFNIEKICSLAEKFYPQDFVGSDVDILRDELRHYKIDVVDAPQYHNIPTLSDLCQMMVETRKKQNFVMIDRLIRLVLTLPVSTATTERAFSAMKILKTDLRSKMDDEFLGDCMVIYIERQFAKDIDLNLMVDEFDDMTDRRVKLR